MGGHSSPSGGVKVFSIGGRMVDERQRCLGMTDEERRWRAQFLKDQILSHGEPRNVPELYKDTTNCIRRLWKTPMYNLEKALVSMMGKRGRSMRHFIGKGTMLLASVYCLSYYFKYHSNNWTRVGAWHVYFSRKLSYIDDPDFPIHHERTPQEYLDDGFYSSPLAKKVQKPSASEIVRGEAAVACSPPSSRQ